MNRRGRHAVLLIETKTEEPIFAWQDVANDCEDAAHFASDALSTLVRGLAYAHQRPKPNMGRYAVDARVLGEEEAKDLDLDCEHWVFSPWAYAAAGVDPGQPAIATCDASAMLQAVYERRHFDVLDMAKIVSAKACARGVAPGAMAHFPKASGHIRFQNAMTMPDGRVSLYTPNEPGRHEPRAIHAIAAASIGCLTLQPDVEAVWQSHTQRAQSATLSAAQTARITLDSPELDAAKHAVSAVHKEGPWPWKGQGLISAITSALRPRSR